MDINEEIIKLKNGIDYVKASQTIGQSNSIIYKIVDHTTLSMTASQYGYCSAEFVFTSSSRSFPHISVEFYNISCSSGNTPTVHLEHKIAGDDMEYTVDGDVNLKEDSVSLDIFQAGANATVTIEYVVYADTPGIISVEVN